MDDDELLKLYGAGAWGWEGTWSLMVRTPGKSALATGQEKQPLAPPGGGLPGPWRIPQTLGGWDGS